MVMFFLLLNDNQSPGKIAQGEGNMNTGGTIMGKQCGFIF